MVNILLPVRLEDSDSDIEPILSLGWKYRVRPGADYMNGSGETVLAEWPTGGGWKVFTGAVATLKLDPLSPDVPYLLEIEGPRDPTSTSRTPVRRTEYRQVVAGTVANTSWYALTRVSAPGPSGVTYPIAGYDQLVAQIAALQAQINALTVGGGGASTTDGITDMSPNARTFNTAANYAAMRTALGAGTSNLVIGTTSGTAPDAATVALLTGAQTIAGNKTLSGNTTFTGTVAMVDGSLAIADTSGLQAALDSKVGGSGVTLTNATLAGTVTVTDGALAIADTNGLQAAIDGKAPAALAVTNFPASQYVDVIITGSSFPGARPTVTAGAPIHWYAAIFPPDGIVSNLDLTTIVAI